MAKADNTTICSQCDGEGKVANSDRQEPWSQWANLPQCSSLAIQMGFVKPIDCPRCDGNGWIEQKHAP